MQCVAVHRGPLEVGSLPRRLGAAGWSEAAARYRRAAWHVYEIAPLEGAAAAELAGRAARLGAVARERAYAGRRAVTVGGPLERLEELAAELAAAHPQLAAAGRALRVALLSTAPASARGVPPEELPPVARVPRTVPVRGRQLRFGERTLIMGVLNVTPDSFSDGGRYNTPDRAVRRALEMVQEGVDVIDVGAESANIAASKPELEEELERLMPVVERLVREVDVPISIDTYKAPVAEAALQAGAHIINDISGLHADPDLPAVCARYGAGVVIMHLQGHPRALAREPVYEDVILDIARYLQEGVQNALAAGVAPERILVDPGIGVGKRTRHNLEVLENLHAFRSLGYPVLLGASRTSVIGNLLETPVGDRLEGTLATTVLAAVHGADMVRVHDIRANARAARVADALTRGWREPEDGWPFDAVTGHQRRPLRELGRLPAPPGAGA
ncbi:MAG TPA: dihydropteroate synthase [Thermaerobacter sp.]